MSKLKGPDNTWALRSTSHPTYPPRESTIFRYPTINVRKFSRALRIYQSIVSPTGRIPMLSLEGSFDHDRITQLIRRKNASFFQLSHEYAGKKVGIALHFSNPNYPALYDLALVFDLEEKGYRLLAFIERIDTAEKYCIFEPAKTRLNNATINESRFRLVSDEEKKYFDLSFPTGEVDFDFLRQSCPHLLSLPGVGRDYAARGEVNFRFLVWPNGKIDSIKIEDRGGKICELATNQFPFDFSQTWQTRTRVRQVGAVINKSLTLRDLTAEIGSVYITCIRKFLEGGDGKRAFDFWKDIPLASKRNILLNLHDEELSNWFDLLWQDSNSREVAVALLKNLELGEMLDFIYYCASEKEDANLLLEMLGQNEQEVQIWRSKLDLDNSRHIIAFLKILPVTSPKFMVSALLADAALPREQEREVIKALREKFPGLCVFESIQIKLEDFDSGEFPLD